MGKKAARKLPWRKLIARTSEEDGYPHTQDQSPGKTEFLKVGAHTHSLVERVC